MLSSHAPPAPDTASESSQSAGVAAAQPYPQAQPQPGQVLLGYELYQPPAGCCMCDGLSPAGLIAGGCWGARCTAVMLVDIACCGCCLPAWGEPNRAAAAASIHAPHLAALLHSQVAGFTQSFCCAVIILVRTLPWPLLVQLHSTWS